MEGFMTCFDQFVQNLISIQGFILFLCIETNCKILCSSQALLGCDAM